MTIRKNLFIPLLTGFALMIGAVACGGGTNGGSEGNDCDGLPEGSCVCTLDDDGITEVDDCAGGTTSDGEACTCLADGPDPNPDANPQPDPQPDGSPVFRFVMVQDEVANPSGDFPGTDQDALGLIKADGREVFAADIEAETDVDCEGNLACDVNAMLGAPDAIDPATGECFGGGDVDATQFVALNGGRVVVSFGTEVVENGDSIHVYEVGNAECGRFDDDSFSVSVSTTDDFTGDVVDLGIAGDGDNIVDVTGLP